MKTTINTIIFQTSFLMMFSYAIAQEQPGLRTRAQQLFDKFEYYNAAQLYGSLVEGRNPRTLDFERLAESYYRIGYFELSENWYARASQQADFSQEGLWNYAEVLKMNGRYSEAKKWLEEYQNKYGTSGQVLLAIAGADSAQHWMAHPTGHQIRGESVLNTDLSEFGAVPTSNGMVYAGEPKISAERSGMTGQPYLKIFSAGRDRNGKASYPAIMDEIFNHASYHVGPITTNRQETVFYVTRTHPGKALGKHRAEGAIWRQSNVELKIYNREGGNWKESDFAYNDVQLYSLGHAALSEDGQTLYYASDMPGGQGGVDIWYSERLSDGSWGTPQNAGPVINSNRDELFPSVSGDTLFYSSNGFAGMGGLDIYRAVGNRNNFADRKNMGHPLNSPADDFAFVSWRDVKGDLYGYLSSNRPGGVGGDDIYSFSKIQPRYAIFLRGNVRNKETGASLPNAFVTLSDMAGNILSKKRSDEAGRVEFALNKELPYVIKGEMTGFYSDAVSIASIIPTADTIVQVELALQPMSVVATKFELKDIYYDFDKSHIRPDAAIVLDELVRVMRDNPSLKIELSSHTDSRGKASYNLALSQRRAQAATNYIVSRGIARDRIVAKGYGETRLANHCADGVKCTAKQHEGNRRTEIEVLAY